MTIEATLLSIDSRLATLISLFNTAQPAPDAFIAGAGAEPVVATQVDAAIAAATPEPTTRRGRGRPAKSETAAVAAAPAPVTAPVAAAADPFAVGPVEVIETLPERTLNEVRAALVVYQTANDQPKALKLLKDAGADTLAQLKQENYGKLFAAAIPSGKLDIADVRAVLVAANERKANGGIEVLNSFGANSILDLKTENFVDAIIKGHGIR
jgi:hypothetical protein